MFRIISLLLCSATLAACGLLDVFTVPAIPGSPGTLSESEIAAGLKEALSVGAERAVGRIGRTDGFWNDVQLRIPLPDSLKKVEKTLRRMGQDRTVDEFHLSLNRAAERAVPEAAGIFNKAIRELTLADAQRVLTGAPGAATSYLRGKTASSLTASFRPIVSRATDAVGVTRRYKDLASKAGRFMSGMDVQSTDLDAYVTERALDGLFRALAEEEKKIRANPAARSSELLQRVFGGRARQ